MISSYILFYIQYIILYIKSYIRSYKLYAIIRYTIIYKTLYTKYINICAGAPILVCFLIYRALSDWLTVQ